MNKPVICKLHVLNQKAPLTHARKFYNLVANSINLQYIKLKNTQGKNWKSFSTSNGLHFLIEYHHQWSSNSYCAHPEMILELLDHQMSPLLVHHNLLISVIQNPTPAYENKKIITNCGIHVQANSSIFKILNVPDFD